MPPLPPPDYSRFTLLDFVLDDSFRQWVLHPTEQTMSFWHSFMLRHPGQQTVIDEASSLLLHLRVRHDDLSEASRERIWAVLETAHTSQFQPPLADPNPVITGRFGRRPFRQWYMAASLAGALLAGGWLWQRNWTRQSVHTQFGELRLVTLPDGSQVQLNGNSTLSWSGNWRTDDERQVWLQGEAFFTVAKIKSGTHRLKFVTHAPNLDITVLGTRFNVNTRRGHTLVVLTEGKIRLSKPNDQRTAFVLMKPGDLATSQAGIEQIDVKPTQPRLHTAWTRQRFVFNNTPLRDIAQELTDTRGINLIFEDNELAAKRFTGDLSSQDLETLITTLATTFDLQVDSSANQIRLRRMPTPAR